MKLTDRHYERRLQRLARREIRASDKLRREWKAQHTVWKQLFDGRPSRGEGWIVPSMAVVFVFGWLFAAFPAADKNPFIAPAMAARLALATPCLFITGISLAILNGNRRTFDTENLAAFAHMPVDDHVLVRSRSGLWWFTGFLLTLIAVIPLLILASEHRLKGERLHIGLVLIAIQWLVTLSCGLLAAAYAGSYSRLAALGLAMILLGGGLPFVSPSLPGGLATAVAAFIYVTPPGWVDAAFVHGLLERRAAAWWFLTPAGGVVLRALPVAIELARARFAFHEFRCHGRGSYQAVFASGFRVPEPEPWLSADSLQVMERQWAEWEQVRADEAEEFLRSGALFNSPYDPPSPLAGKVAASLLSSRQRVMLEALDTRYLPEGAWHRRWWRGLPPVGSLLILLWGLSLLVDEVSRGMLVVSVGMLPLFLDFWSTRSIKTNLIGQYPATLQELAGALLRKEVARMVFLFPLVLAYGVLGMWVVNAPLWHGIVVGLFLVAFRVCLQPALACAAIARATGIFQQPVFCTGWYTLLVTPIIAVLWGQRLAALPPVALSVLAFAFLAAPLVLAWFSIRAYGRNRFDLVVKSGAA